MAGGAAAAAFSGTSFGSGEVSMSVESPAGAALSAMNDGERAAVAMVAAVVAGECEGHVARAAGGRGGPEAGGRAGRSRRWVCGVRCRSCTSDWQQKLDANARAPGMPTQKYKIIIATEFITFSERRRRRN